jgi:hypothetical protein
LSKNPKPASELRSMIAEVRRTLPLLPVGYHKQKGMELRLDAAERRLFPKGAGK